MRYELPQWVTGCPAYFTVGASGVTSVPEALANALDKILRMSATPPERRAVTPGVAAFLNNRNWDRLGNPEVLPRLVRLGVRTSAACGTGRISAGAAH
jgi:hypothetical protein